MTGRPSAAALALALALGGCSMVGRTSSPADPTPVPDPVVTIGEPQAPDDRIEVTLAPPPEEEELFADPILDSRWVDHPVIADRVHRWIDRYGVEDGHAFPIFLERMSAFETLVDSALALEGLPRSLRYIPIIESGYVPSASSAVSAVGLWQFMAPVARSFGMDVSTLVDERRDPLKSSLAAARYLRELDERFGSWFLALAAYNSGPARVDRLIREHAPLSPLGDSVFTVIFPHLPAETRDFIPKLIAAATVAERLHVYGIAPPEPAAPYVFEEVELPDATSLDVVAEAAGVEEDEIRRLNPQLLRGLTPRGRATTVRLPPGTSERFRVAYAEIPPDRRVTVTEHVVARGETLGGIARQYGVRTADLQAANPDVQPRRMRIGTRLLVPRPGVAVARVAAGEHVVRRGDSLWTIARRYGVSVRELQRWNGLREGAVLQPGDRIRLAG